MDAPNYALAVLLAVLLALGVAATAAGLRSARRRGSSGLRCLAAVGGRDNMASILHACRDLGLAGPVRAVCVAASADGPDGRAAEEAMVRLVAAGAQSGIAVAPSVSFGQGVAEGIAGAALKEGAEAVVIGWPDQAKRGAGASGRVVVDELAALTDLPILVVRRLDGRRAGRRLVLAYDKASERATGFARARETAILAWGRPFREYAVGGREVAAGEASSMAGWRELIDALRDIGPERTLLTVLSPRPADALWSQLGERMALGATEALPELAAVFVYLASPEAVEAEAPRPSGRPSDAPEGGATDAPAPIGLVGEAFATGRVRPNMSQAALVDAIMELTRELFPRELRTAESLAIEFSASARREPIELEPGVLLLHAHAEGLAEPRLAIGSRNEGWGLAALRERVRVIAVLVSPASLGPDAHLKALTELAKAFRDGTLSAALAKGEDRNVGPD